MITESLKSKILKIVPERSFLMKISKKVYSSFLFLRFRLAESRNTSWLEKQETQFIASQLKAGMVFLGVGDKSRIFRLLNILKNKNVKVCTFDFSKKENFDFANFLKKDSIVQVDVIKVDVNGREIEFFKNAQNLLSSAPAPVIFYRSSENNTKKFNYHPVEIMWFLQNLGYSLHLLDRESGSIITRPSMEYNGTIVAKKSSIL